MTNVQKILIDSSNLSEQKKKIKKNPTLKNTERDKDPPSNILPTQFSTQLIQSLQLHAPIIPPVARSEASQ